MANGRECQGHLNPEGSHLGDGEPWEAHAVGSFSSSQGIGHHSCLSTKQLDPRRGEGDMLCGVAMLESECFVLAAEMDDIGLLAAWRIK